MAWEDSKGKTQGDLSTFVLGFLMKQGQCMELQLGKRV